MRQSENNMYVWCRQKFALARCEPTVARVRLTLGAVPVSAGVESDDTMSTAHTLIEMTAERGGPAALDGGQNF